ncbi:unnamed protein product [Prorocentrum cordatum]|uniref:Uncharacterized protein n=1 Tax=Prorocentrum cordatum TaxID=2364126 RepID=A0ABN9RBX8_9DINO|nr:unnamed protein product [Polarella glacialis]
MPATRRHSFGKPLKIHGHGLSERTSQHRGRLAAKAEHLVRDFAEQFMQAERAQKGRHTRTTDPTLPSHESLPLGLSHCRAVFPLQAEFSFQRALPFSLLSAPLLAGHGERLPPDRKTVASAVDVFHSARNMNKNQVLAR